MKIFFTLILSVALLIPFLSHAQERELRIGVIASLTGFAAPYGGAVVAGAQVAASELANQNVKVRLIVEDDRSDMRGAATAYQKLKNIDKIQGLIGGSWWLNGIVKTVEKDPIPFISCETLYNKDFVQGRNYFSLAGDLRDWVKVFEPLVEEKGWRSIVLVRFVSGFADTIEEELRAFLSKSGRSFLTSIEYSDIEMTGAPTLAIRALSKNPDVIFVDSQPETFAIFVRELQKLKSDRVVILSHSVADDAIRQYLFDASPFDGRIFFLRRSTYESELVHRFQKLSNRPPQLNGDLGYYAVRLVVEALRHPDPVGSLKAGLKVDNLKFSFDEHNVSHTVAQEVFELKNAAAAKLQLGQKIAEASP